MEEWSRGSASERFPIISYLETFSTAYSLSLAINLCPNEAQQSRDPVGKTTYITYVT
jgi:hypothetical protein